MLWLSGCFVQKKNVSDVQQLVIFYQFSATLATLRAELGWSYLQREQRLQAMLEATSSNLLV